MRKKSYFNPEILDNPNEKFAYFLGLIWADGYVHPTRNTITIQGDLNDINEYYSIIDNITLNKRQNNNFDSRFNRKYVSGVLDISDKLLSNFLKDMDYIIKSNSQPIKILGFLDKKLHKYFLRGLFDGDGSFYVKNKCYHIYLYGPYDQNYDFLNEIMSEINAEGKVSRYIKNNGKFSYFRIVSKIKFKNFVEFLYGNYENDGIGLKRKYEKSKIKNI